MEEELKKKQLPVLSIMRPGLLVNRFDPRFSEKVAEWIPFFPKIEVRDVVLALIKDAESIADGKGHTGAQTF